MIPLQKQYYIQFRQLIADKSIPALKKEQISPPATHFTIYFQISII